MALGTYALLMTLAAGFGAGLQLGGPAVTPLFSLLAYFLPESLLRFGVALAQDRPVGSLLGLPLTLLARATGLVGPPPESPGATEPAEDRRLDDRYSMLEPLLALLPEEDQGRLQERRGFEAVTWGKRTAWLLLAYPGFTAPAQLANLLTKGGGLFAGLILLGTLLLSVEQVRRLGRLSRESERLGAIAAEGTPPSDRFLMLEPLLSFLPVRDQEVLRDRRSFEPVTWGKRTAWLLLVYPGFTAPAQLASLVTRGGGLLAVLVLLCTLFLAVEQMWRLGLCGGDRPERPRARGASLRRPPPALIASPK